MTLSDDELLALLRRHAELAVPPVPDDLHDVALAAFQLAALDATVLDWTYDSFDAAGAVRDARVAERYVSVERGDITIDLDISPGRIDGTLTAPAPVSVMIETPTSASPVDLDDTGWFRHEATAEPFRLRVRVGDEEFLTRWITD